MSAALDEIEKLKKDIKKADIAIAAQEKAIDDARAALALGAKEREAAERSMLIAVKVIEQQQGLISTYEGAIKTLQGMVDMAMRRIDALERKVDRANGRTALLGTILTVAGIVVAVVKR